MVYKVPTPYTPDEARALLEKAARNYEMIWGAKHAGKADDLDLYRAARSLQDAACHFVWAARDAA